MSPVIIDIEASGFGKGSYPIEIGVAMPDESIQCFLIVPLDDWTHWDESAEKIHGISRDELYLDGRDILDVAKTLNAVLEGQVVYTDGWGFDSTWLSLLFYRANMRQTFKLEALTRILTEKQMELWDDTRQQVMLEWGVSRHRAPIDAQVLQETYRRTQKASTK